MKKFIHARNSIVLDKQIWYRVANSKPQLKTRPFIISASQCRVSWTAGVVTDEGGCMGDRRGSILGFPPTYFLTLI